MRDADANAKAAQANNVKARALLHTLLCVSHGSASAPAPALQHDAAHVARDIFAEGPQV